MINKRPTGVDGSSGANRARKVEMKASLTFNEHSKRSHSLSSMLPVCVPH